MSSVTVRLAALCVAALSPITAATQSPDTAIMNKWVWTFTPTPK